jgi:cell division protein FtsB
MHKIFDILLSPVESYFQKEGTIIDKKCESEKLFFVDFSKKLLFAFLTGIDSLRGLVIELQTSDLCKELGLLGTPFSTLKDGFSRFDSLYFQQLYEHVLSGFEWAKVKGFSELGTLCAVDGSLFPTLIQMKWTEYKETANSCKLHLCFELNRMIPTELMITSGNASERKFLLSVAKSGVTYIADRGYFSFDVVKQLHQLGAFFVLRIKSNILFTIQKSLAITHSAPMPACFGIVKDQLITFDNDPNLLEYRLICFVICAKHFRICTNRLDITTLQVIMLYAFRWQIELVFKFIKRTIHGIHLYNNSRNGVQIQLYIIMILALLQLRFKQVCQRTHVQTQAKIDEIQQNNDTMESFISYFDHDPGDFIKNIAQNLYLSWKISKNFIRILVNSINKNIDNQLISYFADT